MDFVKGFKNIYIKIFSGTLMESTGKYDLRDVNRIKILTGAFGLDVHYHSEV